MVGFIFEKFQDFPDNYQQIRVYSQVLVSWAKSLVTISQPRRHSALVLNSHLVIIRNQGSASKNTREVHAVLACG
jgi:hypothetical protein